jgi:hypothetical protein
VEAVNQVYPGRASVSPSLDLFMTLLHWGASGTARHAVHACCSCILLLHARERWTVPTTKRPCAGWQEALQQRETLLPVLLSRLREFAARNGVSSKCHFLSEGAKGFCGF